MAIATDDLITQAALSIHSFDAYIRFVHGWEPREHQRPWIAALSALGYGVIRHSKRSEGCPLCKGVVGCSPEHRTNKLIILAWPSSGKSSVLIEFVCWMIGRSILAGQTPHVGYVCYGDDPAMGRSVAIRDTISGNPRYALLFPTRPDKNKGWGQKEWFLQRPDQSDPHPTLRAAGFGGGILSYRFSLLGIIDDPHPALSM